MRAALIVTSALLASAAAVTPPSQNAFTLAVLRRDAIVVPFATFDGTRWANYWPAPTDKVEVPMTLHSVPGKWWGPLAPIDTWQIWTGSASPRQVRVRQPDWFRTYCDRQIGLRTDYQPDAWPPPPETEPFPKDGLAVWPPRPIDRIDVLPPASPERDGLAATVRTAFAEREAAVIPGAALAHFSAPRRFPEMPKASIRDASPSPVIEAAYAYGTDSRVYFVEAAREYRNAGQCAAVAFGTGWLRRAPSGLSVTKFDVQIAPCDRTGLKFMFPLGAMSISPDVFWIFQSSGWDGESYSLLSTSEHPKVPYRLAAGGSC